tara:strand:- start:226 stop:432 length:207 start_codon:yes stop_codon:yes gene_type:complete
MKKFFSRFIVIIIGIIAIYFFKDRFSEYNLNKSISACLVVQKKTTESFDLKKSKKYCEEQIRKQKKGN